VYGVQTKLAIRMLELHEEAGEGSADVGVYLSSLQTPEHRIDVIRTGLDAEMADTERLLDAPERARTNA
jgi:hypothetical protein